ncbi:MAG: prepilin-type N-terminal cleavage/methylation domain-containing protein [Pirellulaceae bacterium]
MRSIRKGFTLVEMLAVMAVFSVTLSTIVLTLHALQKTGDRAHANISAGVELDRFATQFRSDAHAARTFTVSPTEPPNSEAHVLALTLPNEQIIEYQLSADQILRRVRAGDVDQHRESYRVRPVLERGWTVTANASAPLVTINLQPAQDRGNHPRGLAPLSVQAAVGLTSPQLVEPSK